MTSGRSILAAALKLALPSWQVIADARGLDSVRQPGACVLWTAKRIKAPQLGLSWFKDEVELWILTATDKADLIEDDLDDLLLQVGAVLEPLTSFHWDTAERGTLNESFHGYRITVTCAVQVTPESETN